MKKALLLCTLIVGLLLTHTIFASGISFNCGSTNCFRAGVDSVGGLLGRDVGVITGKGIVQAVQDLIIYLLSFISLIAVIYIMYAGARLLLNPAGEGSAEKTKKIIVGVILGIVIIWFAWWIVSAIFYLLGGRPATASIPVALAETQVRSVDFTTYSNKIRALETKIAGDYSVDVMNELSMLVDGAYQHLPDRADLYANKQRYDAIKKAIARYNLERELIDRGIVENTLRTFIEQSDVYTIEAQPDANPRTGDAPLSVTLEAKEAIDGSGTVIPNENFIWWMRTAEGPQVLGRGKIVNYTFDTEGTYSVYLTINSASKNSQGFTDVISLEKNVTIEIGQPKVKFVIKINDQLADRIVKIPTKEALQNIRIDASETVFASGYTIKTTEWDFGNGETATNEGSPQFETQKYAPGEYTIKLTLTRNDGESFSRNIVLKIGDPLASISTNNKTPHKGERVVFQAQKVSKYDDVQYLWEVKKSGNDTVLYAFSGTRLEYTFTDTGRYFVSLTSTQGEARDKDTMEIIIESRPPNVQFTSEMVSSETPNVYVFDGTNSFDPDYPDNQRLRFEWFVNDTRIQLSETNEQNSRGKYTFPAKGTYRVTLRVTDEDGKTQETKKNIVITSVLSLKLTIRPEVVKRTTPVLLLVTAPPNVATYEWKVGSNDLIVTTTNRLTTSFPVSGIFPVTVKVTDSEGNSNNVVGKVYVTDADNPFSVLDMKSNSSLPSTLKNICDGQEAFTVDRVNAVSFSAERSVNTDGKNSNLTYFWKIGLNKTSTNSSVSYTFDELGCEEITLTVTDKKTGTSHTTTSWVKVINLSPRFSDMQVAVENLDMDPMRVNLKLFGAKDPDGVIRSYTWYYYTDRDDQPQGFRITSIPETTFVLPKISGRYYFDVLMEDSNGFKVNTREVSETRFSTPDLYINTNLATPIIEDFTADATEVNLGDKSRLSLTVRTALDSDVSGKSEYRWDIDGDGFYDIKTSTPFYEFQYKYPGEYNPKVKATHNGVSATRSLTIVVKNRLIPKATLQTIANKIVAYNVSSGLFQSVNWYLDDKKISENRDYLVFDTENSSAKKLKLEISDGKVTEFIVYTIERNLKNQILLKKISGPLIVLSSASGSDMTETPDDLVWEDPMIPLFLYLGESRGDTIRYYVIDTDVDIDTDLNGQKNDDADNKGTASYRNGRPFQIQKGTKRVTVMRIRLIGQDNEDIASRQIRVTRSFLALPDEAGAPTRDPKTFNLSQEDKDRIDKLRSLVQGAPDAEKGEFDKLLDQLGDIWYDTADRTQTLILFSLAVDASPTLLPDLKKKILEQINLIYTQGDDTMNERQAARKVIADALAKTPKKIEIFGDGTVIGLIDQMLDNPEYYEANLVIKQRIYEYVDADKTLSQETKQVVEEKLLLLAGSPPSREDTPPPPATTTSRLSLILWILGGLISIVLGGVGIAYARRRLLPRSEDTLGDHLPGDDAPKDQTSPTLLDTAAEDGDTATTPDWLKEGGSPFGDEDVFSEKAPASSDAVSQPDWIHDTVPASTPDVIADAEKHPDQTIPEIPEDTGSSLSPQTETPPSPETSETPDWLNPSPFPEEPSATVTPPIPLEPVQEAESPEPLTPSSTSDDTESTLQDEENSGISDTIPSAAQDEDVPDWLRGTESTPPDDTLEGSVSGDEEIPLPGTANTSEDVEASPEKKVRKNVGKKQKVPTKKSPTASKKRINSGENLLESEHDMLLPPSDTPPTV